MEHDIDALACRAARLEIADIAADQSKRLSGVGIAREDVVNVVLAARREVIQSDNGLTQCEQLLQQVRPDEPRHTGDQPHTWSLRELGKNVLIIRGNCWVGSMLHHLSSTS